MISRALHVFGLGCSICAILSADIAVAAAPAAPASLPVGQVLLMDRCPSDMKGGPTASAGILAVLGLAVVKNLAVAAADWFASLAEKRNAALSAVSAYEGYGWFYGPGRLTADGTYTANAPVASKAAGCVVVVRYGALALDSAFEEQVDRAGAAALKAAGIGAAVTGDNKTATPDFYAELRLQPARGPLAGPAGTPTAYAFRLQPNLIYFGKSMAKAGTDHAKVLRLEVTLTRYMIDKGALADKPFYTGGYDLDKHAPGTLLRSDGEGEAIKAPAGPLAAFPGPADLKPGAVALLDPASLGLVQGAAVADPVPVALVAKLIETEDPSFIMKAIAKASADNKTKIEEAATAAALKAVHAIVD
ncbi:hypothetical protein [Sphingomonas sp. BK235]|uniref:hypothetical protein n=1 Tax=Sphingomonas sp. BK235 TaxID=2512131 RepID=UPI0010512117|nr:hypothetical protein [Sphingomonas sp. BK235]TCP30116.1 hypothetical protein EV292_11460 [Sphingomonas sp. BK235]